MTVSDVGAGRAGLPGAATRGRSASVMGRPPRHLLAQRAQQAARADRADGNPRCRHIRSPQ
jgi:hypothetical protein